MPVHSHDYSFFPSNFLLSAGTAVVGVMATAFDPIVTGLVLPIIFFAIGKGVDVAVRIYLHKKEK